MNSLPDIHPTLTLFSAKYLVKAQTGYRLINDLKIVLPILTLLLLAAGVYIARGHRRALIGAGLGFAASMLVLGAGLTIFRSMYLNSVPGSVPADAAAALFDTLVRFIRTALRTLLVVGLVVAAGAFFTGPSVTAVRTRSALALRPGLAPAQRRACGPEHRAGRHVDVRAPHRAARGRGGAGRAGVRVLGPAHGGGRDPDRDPAAGGSRADRADRQASGSRPPVTGWLRGSGTAIVIGVLVAAGPG